jgi:T3SS negative regulator,GrlR
MRAASVTHDEDVRVVAAGKYSVWFKTPIGEGAGVVQFDHNGELHGGDSTFTYEGNWKQVNGRFQAALSARRSEPGPPGVFGLDELDITLTGLSYDGGASVSCTGFARQSPGLPLELTLLRIRDDQ